ncbi:MAG: hypothetical protein LBR96_05210 [Treponema sp.]|jgi:hypothetical protein|nr:hypothetical protein [Treponema sp.]
MNKLFGLGLLALILFFPACSCSTGEALIEQAVPATGISGGTSLPPVFIDCKPVSGIEIDFQFSMPVKLVSLNFSPALKVESAVEGKVLQVMLAEAAPPGDKFTADLLVEDEWGNTLNVLIPFRARNDRIPSFLITEIRTEYSKPKAEFIELHTLSEGDMGAVRLIIAGYTKRPLVYEFSRMEVAEGEYILIHLRKIEAASLDELGPDLEESPGTDAIAGARDLWIPGTEKLIHKTDAVYFLDQDDKVIDGIMLSENPDAWWSKEHFVEAAEFLHKQGAWKSASGKIPGPQDAVISYNLKTAMTRSLSRIETEADTNTAADWYICATGAATPGLPNNPKRFE